MSLMKKDLQAIAEVVGPLVKEEVNILRTKMDKQFSAVDKRLGDLRGEMNDRFDQVDHKLAAIDKVLDDLVKFTTEDANELHENHENRIKALEQSQHIP